MKLRISVNKDSKNKSNPKVAAGFKNIEEPIEWLLKEWVPAGYCWCATHFKERYRNSSNSNGSNLVVIDIDGDTTLDKFWNTHTAQTWCAGTYTSASHTEEEHRFRALFPLEKTLDTAAQHQGAYWLVVNQLLPDLGLDKLADNCGQKPERLWYGNTETTYKLNSGACIPADLLEDIEYEDTTEYKKSELTSLDLDRCVWLLNNFLSPTVDGEYESYFTPVMSACAGIGGDVIYEAWVSWVSKGHHGMKPQNTSRSKWRGLGNYAGHTTLYSFAKKQDSNWTASLPPELTFRQTGAAAGYSEVDPEPTTEALLESYPKMNDNPSVEFTEPTPDFTIEEIEDIDVASAEKRTKKATISAAAKERQEDVKTVQSILKDLRTNTLTQTIEYTVKKNNKSQTVTIHGNDLNTMTNKFSCENNIFIPEARMRAAVEYAASLNTYCPIRKYLDNCEVKSKPHSEWDRIGMQLLGHNNLFSTRALQRFMIGSVARAYDPGCSMSWIPILVGKQGAGKSMFCRNLVPDNLFSEISTPLDTLMRESYRLHVGWILELPEIDNYFSSKNIENFKNLISTRVDEIRRPYAAYPEKLRRSFVMIGSTNRNEFLVDATGNRRFVPIEISPDFNIPWQDLAKERDMYWAAAIKCYKENANYEFSAGEIVDIGDYIQQFRDPDPWVDKINSYILTKSSVTAAEVLTNALDLDQRQQSRKESRRVSDVLTTLGWRRSSKCVKQPNGKWKTARVWIRPTSDPVVEDDNDF